MAGPLQTARKRVKALFPLPVPFLQALRTLVLPGLLAALLLAAWAGPAGAIDEEDILRPEEAFRYAVTAADGEVRVRWTIAPAHYLYRERMSFESRTPGVTLGPAVMPQGIPHEDEFFGPMEIYRGEAEVRLPLAERPPGRCR
jgi:thiol:disulfide interchange protein